MVTEGRNVAQLYRCYGERPWYTCQVAAKLCDSPTLRLLTLCC